MSEVLLVALAVLVAFGGAFALTEWAASHWVRTRLHRARDVGDESPLADPFEQDDL